LPLTARVIGAKGYTRVALTITRIPDRYRPGLAKIVVLPPEIVSAMADALAKASVSSLKEMTAAVEWAAMLSTEDAEAVMTSLRSLYIFRASAETSVAEFIPVLIAAMQSSGSRDLAVSDNDKPSVTAKLTSLLGLNTLERASKIEQLKADHHSIFYDAKILTDLRPVFDQPTEQPIGAIVTDTLKITFHECGEHRELYFALDAEDVLTLKKIADRATEKVLSLQALLKSKNLPDFS
jgi:hypothetical protein